MTRALRDISRPDRRIAAKVETLAHLFDVSPETIRRAVEDGKLKPSKALGPVLYRVDDVEKLLFGDDAAAEAPTPSNDDPSVRAVQGAQHGKAQRGRRGSAA